MTNESMGAAEYNVCTHVGASDCFVSITVNTRQQNLCLSSAVSQGVSLWLAVPFVSIDDDLLGASFFSMACFLSNECQKTKQKVH